MVGRSAQEWDCVVQDGLKVVDEVFEREGPEAELRGDHGPLKEAFGDLFGQDALKYVPWLTQQSLKSGELKSGMLVRYRAMIQDVFDPEYYQAIVQKGQNTGKKQTGKFREEVRNASQNEETSAVPGNLGERVPFYCVPIPGENAWAREARMGDAAGASTVAIDSNDQSAKPLSRKRVQPDMEPSSALENSASKRVSTAPKHAENETTDSSSVNTTSESATEKVSSLDEVKLSLPIQNEAAGLVPCIVKVYDDVGKLHVNDSIEVVGILSVGIDQATIDPLEEKFMGLELNARAPPTSLVPRVHCLQFLHSADCDEPAAVEKVDDFTALRKASLELLTEHVFGGDAVAAEFVLLWLASGIQARPMDELLIGKLSLALTQHQGGGWVDRLDHFLRETLPRSQRLTLNVAELNASFLAPRKCNQANRLRAGRLQTCKETPILVDETALDAGQLGATGVRNMQALTDLTRNQVVSYDFEFYSKDWQVDLPVLVVTPNRKPLVQGADLHVPFKPSKQEPTKTEEWLKALGNSGARRFVSALSRRKRDDLDIPEGVCKKIEAYFVELRQQDPKTEQSDLHALLNLVRLDARTRGTKLVSDEAWQHVKALESQRKLRCKSPTQK